VVLGSHRWPRSRRPAAAESVPAIMPRGSVVIYTSWTYHGSGANSTLTARNGLNSHGP
jgi:ectoine hydroxylase-related dioxygenase (phytanoyl-CoA dioxygenase family)